MSPGATSVPSPRPGRENIPSAHLRLVEGGVGRLRIPTPRAGHRDLVSTRTAVLGIVLALCGIGLVMVLSASAYTSLQYYGSVWTIFERQILWMGLGAIAFLGAIRVRYDYWRRLRLVLPLVTVGLLVAVLVPGIGVVAGGSSRWIGVGPLQIQPSELMKLAMAVFAADLLARRADRLQRTRSVVVPLLGLLAVSGLLVLKQPDMGTAMVLAFITFALLYAGGVPLRPVLKALGVTAVLGLIVGLAEPYRRARLLSFLDPFAHAKGSGYQVVQSLVGLGSGHLYGLGLGGGREKWGLLPNAHTDFIFSVIGEEGGLVGTLIVLILFGALAWYGLRAADRAPDRFGALLAVAATCWITSQAVINIGAVIGVLPVTGIPLPFISFGGSSLIITLVAAGMLVNVASHEKPPGVTGPEARTVPQAIETLRRRDPRVRTRRYALVAGGGTGGHLVPALAVARALGEGHGPDAVELVGARHGLDAELLAGEGLPVTLLPGRGFARRLDARSTAANVGAVLGLVAALVGALVVVVRRRPSVVVAMGGYACVPTALAAALVGIPVVLVNVDAVPGAANRLVSRFARAAAVAFEGTALPRSVVTGAPVGAAIVDSAHPDEGARSAAREALGLPRDRLVVAVVGGSLGSKRLNEAVISLAGLWRDRTDVALYHVVGRRDRAWAAQAALGSAPGSDHDGLCYIQVPYEERMGLFYQAADIVVSRAGAVTVAELAVVGVPAILVPLPGAPGDHQSANARVLERAGGAVVIVDPACNGPRLAREIDALASRSGRLAAMAAAAGAVGRPDAVAAVVELTRAHARAPRSEADRARAR